MADRLFPEISHAKKRAFLAALAQSGDSVAAARAARVDRRTVYNWRHGEDEEFRAAFEVAKELGGDALESTAADYMPARAGRMHFRPAPLIRHWNSNSNWGKPNQIRVNLTLKRNFSDAKPWNLGFGLSFLSGLVNPNRSRSVKVGQSELSLGHFTGSGFASGGGLSLRPYTATGYPSGLWPTLPG